MNILLFATAWMVLESNMLNEKSQTERLMLSDFTYMWNLKIKTDEVNMTKQRQIYRYIEQMAAIELGDGEVKKISKRD